MADRLALTFGASGSRRVRDQDDEGPSAAGGADHRPAPADAGTADDKGPDDRLIVGPKGGVITTATMRDATSWDRLVIDLGLAGLVRHGLRHTALTWMADSGVPLYVLQRVAGHQDPAVTARYLHPDTAALTEAGSAFSAWWGLSGGQTSGTDGQVGPSSAVGTGA